MGLRDRKNQLILALKAKKLAYKMTDEQASRFEQMYRRAGSQGEQDQVTAALDTFLNGWKEGSDAYSRLLRDVNEFGDDAPIGDEDDDPPALKEALARSRISFIR